MKKNNSINASNPQQKLLALAVVSMFLSACGGGGGSNGTVPPTPVPPTPTVPPTTSVPPAGISETLQLNGGESTGLSISARYTITNSNLPTEAVTLNSVSGPNTATVLVSPTSGTITAVTLKTPNAARGGAGTAKWISPTDAVTVGSTSVTACAGGDCNTSIRDISLSTKESLASYQYLSFGDWFDDSGSTGTVTGSGGLFVLGQPTLPGNIPSNGTATYTGNSEGIFIDTANSDAGSFDAKFSAAANFSARTLAVATTGMTVVTGGGTIIASSENNYAGTLSYAPGTNQFSGSVATATSGGSGTATGQFFGPTAQEIGGVIDISGSTTRAIGIFHGKQ